jgi:hypothetical protein
MKPRGRAFESAWSSSSEILRMVADLKLLPSGWSVRKSCVSETIDALKLAYGDGHA